jgi:uncharacterized RDD family membrane protein YckC
MSIVRNIIILGLTAIILFIGFLLVRYYLLLIDFPIGIVAFLLTIVSVCLIILLPLFNNRGQHPGDRMAITQVIETKDYKPDRYY